jgi:hypothetical protein
MTVNATYHTFCKFSFEQLLACVARYEDANIAILLASDVIEFQHDNIGFTAINTGMLIKVTPDVFAFLPSLALRALISTRIVQLAIAPVVCFAIRTLTLPTIRTRAEHFKILRRVC